MFLRNSIIQLQKLWTYKCLSQKIIITIEPESKSQMPANKLMLI